jgi:DMSO/TMAO reductase YedYZ molybdopterin-dependent catalytic subunit
VIAGKRSMILHNDRPEDLETPVDLYNSWITPTDSFFVRQHIPRPKVNPDTFALTVDGRVSKELHLTLADLGKLPQYTVPATLECAGNGRGFFRPRVPGIQWLRGAIGNAEWTGPRLSDILKLAGTDPSAQFIEVNGADEGVARTPDFVRSFPKSKAVDPATLLALKMNGAPLPEIHGFPSRLIVPGWDGASWVKWVTRIRASAEPNTGFFMNPGYRFPKYTLPPGSLAVVSELETIEGMPVKSTITHPADNARLPPGAVTIGGFAWAGEHRVERVEVSTDGGAHWKDTNLTEPKLPFAWRLWSIDWSPPQRGYYTILSRATDSAGRVQPFVARWNPSGYLYNAVDRIGVTVEDRR